MARPRKTTKAATAKTEAGDILKEHIRHIEARKALYADTSHYELMKNPDYLVDIISSNYSTEKVDYKTLFGEDVTKYFYRWAEAANRDKNDKDAWQEYVELLIGERDFLNSRNLYNLYSVGVETFRKIYGSKYRLIYDGISQFAGIRIERFAAPERPIIGVDIKGKWTTHGCLQLATEFLGHLDGKTMQDFWQQLLMPPQNTNTLTMIASLEYENMPAHCKTERWSNFEHTDNVVNIPGKYAIDENLSKLTIDELLAIFPEAERRILTLWLGRCFMGGKDIITQDLSGDRPNDWRYGVVLAGDPQTGKSFFIEQLVSYAQYLGLDTAVTDLAGGRFGGAKVARAHLAYNMDAARGQLYQWLKLPTSNGTLSGDFIPTEAKYQAQRDVLAHCAWVVACNNPTLGSNAPPGIVDRLLVLTTYPKDTLEDDGIDSLYHHWSRIVRRLQVENDKPYNFMSLLAHLVAESVEEYRKVIGIDYSDLTEMQTVVKESTLVDTINELRKKLKFRTTINVPTKLTRSTIKATALTKFCQPLLNPPEGHHQVKYSNLGHLARLVCALQSVKKSNLNVDATIREKVDNAAVTILNWMIEDFSHYHSVIWWKINEKARHFDSISSSPQCPDLAAMLQDIVKEVAVDTGERVPTTTSLWVHGLDEVEYYKLVDRFVAELNALFEDDTVKEVLKQALISNSQVNCSYPMIPGHYSRA